MYHRRRLTPAPPITGFTETFVMATIFLVVCVFASMLVPAQRGRGRERAGEPVAAARTGEA